MTKLTKPEAGRLGGMVRSSHKHMTSRENAAKAREMKKLRRTNPSLTETELRVELAKVYTPKSQTRRVYVITDGSGMFKIGSCTNLDDRLSILQTGNPRELRIIGTWRSFNAGELERRLHRRLKTKRVRGEWFELTETDISDLNKLISEEGLL